MTTPFRTASAVIAGLATVVAVTGGAATSAAALPPPLDPPAESECLQADLDSTTWGDPSDGGFLLHLTVSVDAACEGGSHQWLLQLAFGPGHEVTSAWNADWTVAGDPADGVVATAEPLSWNGPIGPGDRVSLGLTGSYSDGYQEPEICVSHGAPCLGQPPEVTLTAPADDELLISVCPVTLAAEASSPAADIDRVEFYVDDQLVGVADAAPYQVEIPPGSGDSLSPTAFARAYDTQDPPRSTDSRPVDYALAIPPPALMLISCTPELQLVEGESDQAVIALSGVADSVEITVTGDADLTVDPASFTLGDGVDYQHVTVTAEPGSAGSTATLVAASDSNAPASVAVEVIAAP